MKSFEEQEKQELQPIDLMQTVNLLLSRIRVILLTVVVFAVAAFGYTRLLVTPLYTTGLTFYIRSSQEVSQNADSVDYNELEIARRITETYLIVLKSDVVLEAVADQCELGYSAAQIRSMISATAVEETPIIKMSITNADPEHAVEVANVIAEVAPTRIAEYLEGSAVRILDYPKVPTGPSSPNFRSNVMIGAVVGLVLSCLAVVVIDMLDVRIKTEEDLEELSDLPILGTIPDMDGAVRGKKG